VDFKTIHSNKSKKEHDFIVHAVISNLTIFNKFFYNINVRSAPFWKIRNHFTGPPWESGPVGKSVPPSNFWDSGILHRTPFRFALPVGLIRPGTWMLLCFWVDPRSLALTKPTAVIIRSLSLHPLHPSSCPLSLFFKLIQVIIYNRKPPSNSSM
jgi:hypothetical protein